MQTPVPGGTDPVSRIFGLDRGRPIDRYYIEAFLEQHAADVRGRVLEFGDSTYTRRLGSDRVVRSDVLDARDGNPVATLVADLADAPAIPDEAFDCIVCTQVLQYVYDLRAAAATLRRILAPGGVLLASVPGISQLSRHDADTYGEYWRFTAQAARRLFGDAFGGAVEVRAAGNVYVATSFLRGWALEDLDAAKLDLRDPDYELVVLVRAQARA